MVCYAIIILAGIIAALPNVLTSQQLASVPSWLPKQQVTLGLDLRGGAHLVLEIDAVALKKNRLRALLDEVSDVLRREHITPQSKRLTADAVLITVSNDAQRTQALQILRGLASAESLGGGAAGPGIEVSIVDSQIRLMLTEAGLRDRLTAAIQQSLEIIRQRVDQVGVTEPTIQRVGADRVLVQLPGLQDPARLRKLLGSTAKMTFHMVADVAQEDRPPPGVSILPDAKTGWTYPIEDSVALDGARLADARAGFDQRTQEPIVSLRFDSAGARQFADITSKNVGRPFAIVLDGKVLSAPVIKEPISGGSGQIGGSFTVEDTAVLSALLRAGALPAPLTVIEERIVGPDLGGDVIKMGLLTGVAGFALVVALMFLLYRGWGLIANIALALNVILTVGVLSAIGATLTLPGIAGIILGIGLAVDANILINERIREETRRGQGAFAALDQGFKRAYSTIVDANVTSLIVTALLFMFGSGPVRGFAITMMLGIVISMFTAVTIVRILMTEVVRWRKMKVIRIEPLFKLVPEGTGISFMKARFLGIEVSIFLSIASTALFFKPGLNYGIDFMGGVQMEITTSQPADLAQLRDRLGGLGLGEVSLQNIGGDRNVLIRVERQEGGEVAQTAAVERLKAEIAQIDSGAAVERSEVVGPKVSGELAQSGILAVILASLAMLGYIWWRFEWHFAVGAIATLILDTTKTVGFARAPQDEDGVRADFGLPSRRGSIVLRRRVIAERGMRALSLYRRWKARRRSSCSRRLRAVDRRCPAARSDAAAPACRSAAALRVRSVRAARQP